MFAFMVSARNVPDPADATGFFTTVADKLLRSTFSFGSTNIPVQTDGVFVYTPAVHRLLQVAANLRDAATTNFFPTIYRPVFFNDGLGNVFITGFEQIQSATQFDYPLAQSPILASQLPPGISTNNVYDVPWIIGVKKGFPNFNEFVARNDFQITRKLQVTRSKIESYTATTSKDFETNEMFVMSITNHMGFSFWNSYAADYVPVSGSVSIVVRDVENMVLSNGLNNGIGVSANWPNPTPYMNQFVTNLTVWPGSSWNVTQSPGTRSASTGSYVAGTFDFAFLPTAVYEFATGTFVPASDNPPFETSATINPTINLLPQFSLLTTNGLQAYILDGDNIIDYVQFSGPSSVRNLNAEIQDNNPLVNTAPFQMWITNASGAQQNGMSLGVVNQILVSRTGPGVAPANSWVAAPNLPPGTAIPQGEANFFAGFFTPSWTYNGKVYVNTNLAMQAPYTPNRLAYDYTMWQANDPLVHYLSSDLNEVNDVTGDHHSDDPVNQAPPSISQYLGIVGDRYQPWARAGQLAGLSNVDNNPYNLAYKDPLVYGSDNWNFPATNNLPLTTLGQVHRGTPWQTIYLKAANIVAYVNAAQSNPLVGLNTWQWWTGDFDTNDAELMSPTSDWRLAALLAELFNTNDATQLESVNATAADWLNVLNGVIVQTNSTAIPSYYPAPQFDQYMMASNSTQAAFIASALGLAKASQPGQSFFSAGDILSAPEISQLSPWLNQNDSYQINYNISDAAYEAIPAQLLPLLRPDSIGGIVFTNGTWNVQFSGSDIFTYELQTSANLRDWQIVNTNCPMQGIFNSPVGPLNVTQQFYRSVLRP